MSNTNYTITVNTANSGFTNGIINIRNGDQFMLLCKESCISANGYESGIHIINMDQIDIHCDGHWECLGMDFNLITNINGTTNIICRGEKTCQRTNWNIESHGIIFNCIGNETDVCDSINLNGNITDSLYMLGETIADTFSGSDYWDKNQMLYQCMMSRLHAYQ